VSHTVDIDAGDTFTRFTDHTGCATYFAISTHLRANNHECGRKISCGRQMIKVEFKNKQRLKHLTFGNVLAFFVAINYN
jgi:hypothetical protein